MHHVTNNRHSFGGSFHHATPQKEPPHKVAVKPLYATTTEINQYNIYQLYHYINYQPLSTMYIPCISTVIPRVSPQHPPVTRNDSPIPSRAPTPDALDLQRSPELLLRPHRLADSFFQPKIIRIGGVEGTKINTFRILEIIGDSLKYFELFWDNSLGT